MQKAVSHFDCLIGLKCQTARDPTRDGCIKVGAAEKKKPPTAISMQLFWVLFFQFFEGKK